MLLIKDICLLTNNLVATDSKGLQLCLRLTLGMRCGRIRGAPGDPVASVSSLLVEFQGPMMISVNENRKEPMLKMTRLPVNEGRGGKREQNIFCFEQCSRGVCRSERARELPWCPR